MEPSTRYRESRRITLMGAAKNSFLCIIKIFFGITGHSHALFADGVHSLSDLIIDTLVLMASRFGSKAADSDHPYGHGRIETAATMLLAFFLALAGIGIIIDAGYEIYGVRAATKPDSYVLIIALFSVVVNEILFQYTRLIGKKIKSNLLITNAWHHRSDSGSSLVVLLGAGGAILGFPSLDAIAAVIVGIMILKTAWTFGWSSIRELVDTGVDETTVEKIKATIKTINGVRAVHQLRTRSIAGAIFLDVHVLVDSYLSVSEGHYIGQQVHFKLTEQIPEIVDVTLHVDPEDDEIFPPSLNLPNRDEILRLLQQQWQSLLGSHEIQRATLHYLSGKVQVELHLPANIVSTDEGRAQLVLHLQAVSKQVDFISQIKVLFS